MQLTSWLPRPPTVWRAGARIGVGQLRLPECNADLGLPDMDIAAAKAAGVKTVIVGVANRGGVISEAWLSLLEEALEAGMDIASGLHTRLSPSNVWLVPRRSMVGDWLTYVTRPVSFRWPVALNVAANAC